MSLTSDISNYELIESNNPYLKYQRFTPLGCKDKRIRKFKLVANTESLSLKILVSIVELRIYNIKLDLSDMDYTYTLINVN